MTSDRRVEIAVKRKQIEQKADEFAELAAAVVIRSGKDDPTATLYTRCLNAVLAVVQCADAAPLAAFEMFGECESCMSALDDCGKSMLTFGLDTFSAKRDARAAKSLAQKKFKLAKKRVDALTSEVDTLDKISYGGIPTDLGEKRISEIIANKQ